MGRLIRDDHINPVIGQAQVNAGIIAVCAPIVIGRVIAVITTYGNLGE